MRTQKQTHQEAQANIESPYLTMKQAQAYLSVERGTLYKWAKLGIITIYKIGGAIRFKRSEIDSALQPVKPLL